MHTIRGKQQVVCSIMCKNQKIMNWMGRYILRAKQHALNTEKNSTFPFFSFALEMLCVASLPFIGDDSHFIHFSRHHHSLGIKTSTAKIYTEKIYLLFPMLLANRRQFPMKVEIYQAFSGIKKRFMCYFATQTHTQNGVCTHRLIWLCPYGARILSLSMNHKRKKLSFPFFSFAAFFGHFSLIARQPGALCTQKSLN